jgi:hypothetical protein
MDAGFVEPPAKEVDVPVRTAERPAQPFELKRLDLISRGDLDGIELAPSGGPVEHEAIIVGPPDRFKGERQR